MRLIVAFLLAFAISALTAELPLPYNSPEQKNLKPDIISELVETHSISNKENNDKEHPIYKANLPNIQGRARIEPVKPTGPIINYHRMLSDQSASTEVNKNDVPDYGYAPGPSEVAYPDIPYAPGYGYAGYPDSDRYSIYNNELLEPDTSAFGLLWSQVPDSRTLVSYAGRTIVWVFNSIFVLLIGSLITIGACTYTNLCTIHFHGIGPIHEEMRALMSPERLEKISTAADFVKTAIDKYQKIQTVTGVVSNNKKKRNASLH